ncbi:M6 family metalloprotease domain-containing protein [Bacteroidota bacterium]
MKKIFLSFIFSILVLIVFSAPFKFLPHKVTQPDGAIIECFLSGDEFFNWIHDKDGYSIIKGSDGYYYYAIKEKGEITASSYKVNTVNPNEVDLKKWTIISKEEYVKKREYYNAPYNNGISKAPHTGQLNNLVIYIRFSGESEITTTRQAYDDKLNPETGYSLKSFYKEASYDQLTINSTHYPDCASPTTTNASYEDSHTRAYFQPYDASTNPIGYSNDSESTEREHQLLVDAITWINTNYPVEGSLNIDGDNDGRVDNVCFMIQGNSDGWSDLLWAHRWSLYTQTVYINSKRVYDYTFQPENQVGVRTLCHEMFHALGAPDLYHYYNGTDLDPAGPWDVMESGYGHMGAYMKYKYADQNWITDIPEITTAGTYSLNPLTSATNNCYKIASPNSTSEFFIVEYRLRSGSFESNLPGDGLIIYRINSDFDGNAQYDGSSVFDEVYIYRPGGNTTTNGTPDNANFSSDVSRTAINDATNPSSFLHDGTDGGLDIYNITSSGATISFDVRFGTVSNPVNFNAVAVSKTQIDLDWELNGDNDNVVLAYSTDGTFGAPVDGTSYSAGGSIPSGGEVLYTGTNTSFNHLSLISGQAYYYKVWSANSSDEYSNGISTFAYTPCDEMLLPLTEDFSDGDLPTCWINQDYEGSGQVWEFDNPGGISFSSTTNANGFTILDSDNYGSGYSQDAALISPLLDLSIYESVNLQFEHYYRDYSTELAELAYSIDGGQNWTVIQSWSSTEGSSLSPAIFNTDISSYVAGESSVRIRWRYEGSYGYYWILDDIEITGVSAGNPAVTTKNASEITYDQATLNGTINANDNSITEIKFEYGTITGTYTDSINATPNTASGTLNTSVSALSTGLSANTEYFYRLKCKNGIDILTGDEKSFVTEDLPDPVVLTNDADGIDIDLATLHGTVNANDNSITEIQFEYGTVTGTYTNSVNATPNTATGTSNTSVSVEITGLTTNTEFFYRVKCKNGSTTLYGDEKSFTTEARPTISITSNESDYTNLSPFDLTFSFSEAIASLIDTDISVTNASISDVTNEGSNVYTVEVTPTSDGDITVQLTENSVDDIAGYGNIASNVFSIEYDGTLPTVAITSTESTSTQVSPIPLTFTFSEDITDFAITDITVTNGTAGNFNTTSASIYTAEITPSSDGTVTAKVNANAVTDIASNTNAVSDTWTITYTAPTGIGKLNEMGIALYPNPTNGLLKVELTKSYTTADITVVDQSGRVVYTNNFDQATEQKIDLTNQAKGVYIILFNIDNKQISTQLIIQ